MSKGYLNGIAPDGTSFDFVGEADKPVLCLIHGLGLSRKLWADYLPEFEKDFRVLNYDLYGHGSSAPAPEEASLTVFSNQLAGLLDHLKIAKASVIGFSIGGMINRRFAMDHADKLEDLVILNSPHDRGEEAQQKVEARAASVREQGAFSTFDEALKRWFTPEYLATGTGPDDVRKWRGQVDAESYAQSAWVLANGVRELICPKQPIAAHTLVMTSENDSGSTPKMSEDISAEIPGSELIVVPGLQHLGLMEQPEMFLTPVQNFLKRSNP
ncbi:MAG: alpha/beta fold hydrolase [Rhizobiaceae bacterium]|nr:alpha/beta fold hydrolase [Rhizobiaceae bacterium]